MIVRVIILISVLAYSAAGQQQKVKRITRGDPLPAVYAALGTPALEYPLDGQLVLEYKECTIITRNKIVVSVDYKEPQERTTEAVEDEEVPLTITEIESMAMAGDAESQYLLAYCYQFGKSLEQDYNSAIKWYRKSAMQGHMPSQHNLGYLYMNGRGVEKDYTQAYMWAILAAENGNERLKRALEYKTSPEQKQKAMQMAEQLRLRMNALESEAVSTGEGETDSGS